MIDGQKNEKSPDAMRMVRQLCCETVVQAGRRDPENLFYFTVKNERREPLSTAKVVDILVYCTSMGASSRHMFLASLARV